jgi:hemolysin activation/secretion protein
LRKCLRFIGFEDRLAWPLMLGLCLMLASGAQAQRADPIDPSNVGPRPQREDAADQPTAPPEGSGQPEAPAPADPPQTEAPTADEAEGPIQPDPQVDGSRAYPIDRLELRYAPSVEGHPDHPQPAEVLKGVSVRLTRTDQGWIAHRPKDHPRSSAVRLDQLPQRDERRFYPSAIVAMARAIVRRMNQRGYIGVFVTPQPQGLEDAEQPTLVMEMLTSTVGRVRTLAGGRRIRGQANRINNPKHRWIREHSPLRPAPEASDEPVTQPETGPDPDPDGSEQPPQRADVYGDLLREAPIDRYINFLNRFPGRSVEAAIGSGQQEHTASLDYLVNESRPLFVYAQVSNAGTESTNRVRQRVGLTYAQLLGIDDTLDLDYSTASLDTHSVSGGYELPLTDSRRLRGRVHGLYSTYQASDVGQSRTNFDGQTWAFGAELKQNLLQFQNPIGPGWWFADLSLGVRVTNVRVESETFGLSFEGESMFVIPVAGLSLEKRTRLASTNASLSIEWIRALEGSAMELGDLGRDRVDQSVPLLRGSLSHSIYLEPLLNPRGWANPERWGSSTLAHELSFRVHGQLPLNGERLVPQFQATAGGLFTVRGYEESFSAGDAMVGGSLEYRLHIPRLLKPKNEPIDLLGRPFNLRPPRVYAAPDWDLVLKGFVDGAFLAVNDPERFEKETQSLLGGGVGVELSFRQRFSVRLDWGAVLLEVERGDGQLAEVGDNRLHILATLMF